MRALKAGSQLPGVRVSVSILDCHLIIELVGAERSESLGEMDRIAVEIRHHIQARFAVGIRDVDQQAFPVPAPARIAQLDPETYLSID